MLGGPSVSVAVVPKDGRLARPAGAVLSFQLVLPLAAKKMLQMATLSLGSLSEPSKGAGWAPPTGLSLGVPRGAPLVRQSVATLAVSSAGELVTRSVLPSWGPKSAQPLGRPSAPAWGVT